MLVATRDPMLQPGPHDPSRPHRDPRDGMRPVAHPAPRAARMVTMLQLTGSLLAIPVGLASAYSIYKANFSPDTACLALRTNIIAMIDKKIDATTRRMLVRRDVETFEKSCGAFDPDAKAAFVTLLAAEPRTVPARAAPAAKAGPPKAEAKTEAPKVEAAKAEPAKTEPAKSESVKAGAPAKETRKAEPRPAAVKQAAAPTTLDAEATARDASASDARWLDAVRGALVNHETAAREAAAAVDAPVAARVAAPEIRGSLKANAPAPQPSVAQPAAPAPQPLAPQAPVQDAAAPALPPATSVGEPPAQSATPRREADADHPVPPGSIPDGAA